MKRLIGVLTLSSVCFLSACAIAPINTDHRSLNINVGEEGIVTIMNHDRPDRLSIWVMYRSNVPFRGISVSPFDYVSIRRSGDKITVKGLKKTEDGYYVEVRLTDPAIYSSRSGLFTVTIN